MYLKVFVCLLIVGYCASVWTGSKRIKVDEEGNVIEITTGYGKKIHIVKHKPGWGGRKEVDVSVSGPHMPTKHVRFDDREVFSDDSDSSEEVDERLKRSARYFPRHGKSQSDILTELCLRFHGVNDEKSYRKFIEKLEKYVKKGEVDPVILDLIRELDYQEAFQSDLVGPEGCEGLECRRKILQRVLCAPPEAGYDNVRTWLAILRDYPADTGRLSARNPEEALRLEREGNLAGIRDYRLGSGLPLDPLSRLHVLGGEEDLERRFLGAREGPSFWTGMVARPPLWQRYNMWSRTTPYGSPFGGRDLRDTFSWRQDCPLGVCSESYLQRFPSDRFGLLQRPWISRESSPMFGPLGLRPPVLFP